MAWATRSDLAKAQPPLASGAILFAEEPGEAGAALAADELTSFEALSRAALAGAGLGSRDRVLFALNQPGSIAVAQLARAAAPLVASVAVTGAAGRLRLLNTIRALKPNTLVCTPCGAADFLARLYMEFNIDPLELGLEKIVIAGEIASPGTPGRIAKEFEVDLSQLYLDPLFGAALAYRKGSAWKTADDGVLALAAIGSDEIVAEDAASDAAGELVLRPNGAKGGDRIIRTGQVVAGSRGDTGFFNHTVGDHVLVRGRWVSLPLLRRQLNLVDGIASWALKVDRGNRTLDAARLEIGFERETLVTNKMWKGLVEQAVAAATPIQVEVTTEFTEKGARPPESVRDARGHHLGQKRAEVTAA